MNKLLYELESEGYAKDVNYVSGLLGKGLSVIQLNHANLIIFESGIEYQSELCNVQITYRSLLGIKSFLTMDLLSEAQRKPIKELAMRFECNDSQHDLNLPFAIYSRLLGYFYDKAKEVQKGEVETGFAVVDEEF